ncbi:peroxisome biogenesis factor 10 [Neodiprion lecontei]|uniref:RING-type E3 ubiquitin transferase n=1 Tax=Neodiprion lecontei TaxID=441921 RepID=A0A6J0C9N5_NEOLC|nr:peroxisome biogenesis factor 10 [Neodiprion lecontei]XP_015523267.1 peroxisome biogenesis factor 10 [Neodiprion lecontei]XP_046598094.1 peroxisome biogenesis factor 10 [Neodiprion lecontei]
MERVTPRGFRSKGANQAEILRARQRDDMFVTNLRENLSELMHKLGGSKLLLHIVQSELPAKFAYFIATTAMNNQTIGEEYTGIIQADLKALKVPSLAARTLAILLECFGEQVLIRILDRLLVSINNPGNELTPEAKSILNFSLTRLRTAIPIVILAHRGLFYILGRYYSLSKRIAGVDYIKVYGRRPAEGISWGLRLLGVATIAQCLLKLWSSRQLSASEEAKTVEITKGLGTDSRSCQLCLEVVPTTATPCGHLFCWQCISDWLAARPQCPLCREYAHPSRIIYLLNI